MIANTIKYKRKQHIMYLCYRGLRRVQLCFYFIFNRERVLLHVSKKNREDAPNFTGLQFHKFFQTSS